MGIWRNHLKTLEFISEGRSTFTVVAAQLTWPEFPN